MSNEENKPTEDKQVKITFDADTVGAAEDYKRIYGVEVEAISKDGEFTGKFSGKCAESVKKALVAAGKAK